MPTISFGEWTPDQPNAMSGITRADNALPTSTGYESGPSVSNGSTIFPPVPQRPHFIKTFYDTQGVGFTFAFCPTAIYELTPISWRNITHAAGPYTTPNNRMWEVVAWGNYFFAVNDVDKIQQYNFVGGSEVCVDIDGTETGVVGRLIAIIGDHLVLADTVESEEEDYRIRWSGRLRPTMFEPSLVTQAGWRDCVDIGSFRKLVSMSNMSGILLGQTGFALLEYIGPPGVFSMRTMDRETGCLTGASVISVSDRIFWLSSNGWRMYAGGGRALEIGAEKVDRTTLKNLDPDYIDKMSVILLPDRPVIMWLTVSRDSPDHEPDQAYFYNYLMNRWSFGRITDVLSLGVAVPPVALVDPAAGPELTVGWKNIAENAISAAIAVEIPLKGYVPGALTVVGSGTIPVGDTGSNIAFLQEFSEASSDVRYELMVANWSVDELSREIELNDAFLAKVELSSSVTKYVTDPTFGSIRMTVFDLYVNDGFTIPVEIIANSTHTGSHALVWAYALVKTYRGDYRYKYVVGETVDVDVLDMDMPLLVADTSYVLGFLFDSGASATIEKGDESDDFEELLSLTADGMSVSVLAYTGEIDTVESSELIDLPPQSENLIDVFDNHATLVAVNGELELKEIESGTAVSYFQTTEVQLTKGARSKIVGARLLGETKSVDYRARVLSRDTQNDQYSVGPWVQSTVNGRVPLYKKGRYTVLEVEVSNFPGVTGVDVDATPEGKI